VQRNSIKLSRSWNPKGTRFSISCDVKRIELEGARSREPEIEHFSPGHPRLYPKWLQATLQQAQSRAVPGCGLECLVPVSIVSIALRGDNPFIEAMPESKRHEGQVTTPRERRGGQFRSGGFQDQPRSCGNRAETDCRFGPAFGVLVDSEVLESYCPGNIFSHVAGKPAAPNEAVGSGRAVG
jgi:hypothetical protein